MRRILAEVRVPIPDPEDPTQTDRDEEGNEMLETREMYIHHWGLQTETTEDKNGNLIVIQYTVGICEDVETGQIHTFMPTQLKAQGLVTYGGGDHEVL